MPHCIEPQLAPSHSEQSISAMLIDDISVFSIISHTSVADTGVINNALNAKMSMRSRFIRISIRQIPFIGYII